MVDHKQLWKFGRYFILIAFTVGAIFSPPDVVSQTLVSVPLCLLYFLSIILVYFFGTKRTEPEVKLAKPSKRGAAAQKRADE
jgi:sec-independent protein translocase protein TatC